VSNYSPSTLWPLLTSSSNSTSAVERQGAEHSSDSSMVLGRVEQLVLDAPAAVGAAKTSIEELIKSSHGIIINKLEDAGAGTERSVRNIQTDLKSWASEFQTSIAAGQAQTSNLLESLKTPSIGRSDIEELSRLLKRLVLQKGEHPPTTGGLHSNEASPLQTTTGTELAIGVSLHRFYSLSRDVLLEIIQMLTAITRVSLLFISRLAAMIPELFLYLKVLSNIPSSPTTLLLDNIRFEDVLGRTHSLQYQQFKHWRIFKSMLECAFENKPGREKVFAGRYRIMNARFQDRIIDESNWEQKIFPGTQIVMSVDISEVKIRVGCCPRVQCSGTIRVVGLERICEECRLRFFTDSPAFIRPTQRVAALSSGTQNPDFKAEVARTRAHLKRLGVPYHGAGKGKGSSPFNASTVAPSEHARFLDMLKKASEIPQPVSKSLREIRLKAGTSGQEELSNSFGRAKEAERVAREREEEELLLFRRVHITPQDKQTPKPEPTTNSDPNVGDTGIIQITVHDFSFVSPTNPLYQAIGDEDAQQVTKLIETGIDVNQVDPESGTPLQAAISLGSNEMADLLLQYGANPLIGDSANNAIHSATVHRNVFVLTLVLINARSRIDLSSREDLDSYMNIINRALYIASLQCYNHILLALINAGADPLVKLDNNQNALEAALFSVSKGVNTSAKDEQETTLVILLLEAINAGQMEMTQGADLMVAATNGLSIRLQSFTDKEMLEEPGTYGITSPNAPKGNTRSVLVQNELATVPQPLKAPKTSAASWICCLCYSRNHTVYLHNCHKCTHPRCWICKSNDSTSTAVFAKEGAKRVYHATFKCSVCHKGFTRAYNLRNHLQTHMDVRPFLCFFCGKGFARQGDQKMHEGLHRRYGDGAGPQAAEAMFVKGMLQPDCF
jgi:hypothetical protein